MESKTFTIKGKKITILTSTDGRRAPSPESIPQLTFLALNYPDLRSDKDAQEMAKFLEKK